MSYMVGWVADCFLSRHNYRNTMIPNMRVGGVYTSAQFQPILRKYCAGPAYRADVWVRGGHRGEVGQDGHQVLQDIRGRSRDGVLCLSWPGFWFQLFSGRWLGVIRFFLALGDWQKKLQLWRRRYGVFSLPRRMMSRIETRRGVPMPKRVHRYSRVCALRWDTRLVAH